MPKVASFNACNDDRFPFFLGAKTSSSRAAAPVDLELATNDDEGGVNAVIIGAAVDRISRRKVVMVAVAIMVTDTDMYKNNKLCCVL